MGKRLLFGVFAFTAALAASSGVLAMSGSAVHVFRGGGLTVSFSPAAHGRYHVRISGASALPRTLAVARAARIEGTPGPDVLVGTTGNDWINGGAGGDAIYGLAGNDILFGGPGNDQVWGGPGNDVMYGGPGQDTMVGRWGNDRIYTRDGQRDFVQCGAGYDVVIADRVDVIDVTCDKVIYPK